MKRKSREELMIRRMIVVIAFYCAIFQMNALGQTTQTQYLSGTGKDNTVLWNFTLSTGRNSGTATTIPVPSNWELKGFGAYGYQTDPAPEQGTYHYTFSVPAAWNGMAVSIVFDGVMTDANVTINNQSAGPVHQGGFCRFKYDITSLLNFTGTNTLQVVVSRVSANASVNNAERIGDYWNFSGIYRPVYLEAYPKEHIDRIAINAKADGSVAVDAYPLNLSTATSVTAQVRLLDGTAVGAPFTANLTTGQTAAHLAATIANPGLWSMETPTLYRLDIGLMAGTTTIHTITEKFGFRTVEVRAGNGIYINNQRMKFRGTCRHCFWPTEGRTLNRAISISDVLLMKDMNMNAVRMSHYPPDEHFLDVCDSLGLYVFDELPGWQHQYDTDVGKKLITEMVSRDVNHPCVVMWDNANEGGWNTALDSVFGNRDPQKRGVMHPGGGTFGNIADVHYNQYSDMQSAVNGTTIYLPTEFLHGLYDGGLGSGLYDYWNLMGTKSICAGGFLWAFLDEGVVRTDQNNIIDTHGNMAPDGIVGPYREKEGSYYTVKEIWSPVYIDMDTLPASFSGTIPVENRFDFTNLNACSFSWKLVNFDFGGADSGRIVAKTGNATVPSILPHAAGSLTLGLPADWKNYQGLLLTATDPFDREIYTWSWMIKSSADIRKTVVDTTGGAAASFTQTTSAVTVTAGAMQYVFSKTTGNLTGVTKNGKAISFVNGPAPSWGTSVVSSISATAQNNAVIVSAQLSQGLQSILWTIYGNGWCKLTYNYSLNGSYDYYGVDFDYPEAKATSLEWLGLGPYHAWKNRLKGGTYNVWRTAYNNGVAGEKWVFPEFKGYFADVKWARLFTSEDTLNFVFDDQNVFVRNFTAGLGTTPSNATATFPSGNISFLQGISPMGDKFHAANLAGPQGQKNAAAGGSFARTVYMYFGSLAGQTGARQMIAGTTPGSGLEIRSGSAGASSVRFFSQSNAETRIVINDMRGRTVKVLFSGPAKAGWQTVVVPGMPGGVYLVRMMTKGEAAVSEKVFLVH
jgi:hypothetical protein